MNIKKELLKELAEYGIKPPPDMTETQIEGWLIRTSGFKSLLLQAKRWQTPIKFGMTKVQVQEALSERLLQLLEERGYRVDAEVAIHDRRVRITSITRERGSKAKVVVHYWTIEPWEHANDRGRNNHVDAAKMLEKGRLLPT